MLAAGGPVPSFLHPLSRGASCSCCQPLSTCYGWVGVGSLWAKSPLTASFLPYKLMSLMQIIVVYLLQHTHARIAYACII